MSNASVNAKMKKVASELVSEYSKYPIEFDAWLKPGDTTDKGEACFLASTTEKTRKLNYIYSPRQQGYYHLMTREAYQTLSSRLDQELTVPVGCFGCMMQEDSEKVRAAMDVKAIVKARAQASKPDDKVAKREALKRTQDRIHPKKAAAAAANKKKAAAAKQKRPAAAKEADAAPEEPAAADATETNVG